MGKVGVLRGRDSTTDPWVVWSAVLWVSLTIRWQAGGWRELSHLGGEREKGSIHKRKWGSDLDQGPMTEQREAVPTDAKGKPKGHGQKKCGKDKTTKLPGFRPDKTHFPAKPPRQALSRPCWALPASPPLATGNIYVLHCYVLWLQSDPWGSLASSLLSSKDLTSTFQLSWSQLFLRGTLLIHRPLEFWDEGRRMVYVPSSEACPWAAPWGFWLRSHGPIQKFNSELEIQVLISLSCQHTQIQPTSWKGCDSYGIAKEGTRTSPVGLLTTFSSSGKCLYPFNSKL